MLRTLLPVVDQLGSLNLEAVMRDVVQDIGRMMNLSRTQIRLSEPETSARQATNEPIVVIGQEHQREET